MALYIPRKVPGNWYKYDARFSIELLDVFVRNIESQVNQSIQDYILRVETELLTEYEGHENEKAIEIHKGLNSETWDLDGIFERYLPNLQRKSALIYIYSFFEHELDMLCSLFKAHEQYGIDFKDFKDSGIERAVKYLVKVANLPIDKNDNKWESIKMINKIRNLIVHNNGKLTDIDNKLKSPELAYVKQCEFLSGDDEIEIEEGYLLFVLTSFNNFFIYLDKLIEEKYFK